MTNSTRPHDLFGRLILAYSAGHSVSTDCGFQIAVLFRFRRKVPARSACD